MEKPPQKTILILYIFFLFSIVSYLTSCSDIAPQILSSDVKIVFDYETEDSAPILKFSVFVQPDGNVRKLDKVIISSEESDYTWEITNPEFITNKTKEWAGYANLEPRDSEIIPKGKYILKYVDLNGSESRTEFSVSYNSDFVTSKAADAPELMGTAVIKKAAVYNSQDVLLYNDDFKDEWTDDSVVWQDFPDADSYRVYLIAKNEKILCLLPAVYRTEIQSPAADESADLKE